MNKLASAGWKRKEKSNGDHFTINFPANYLNKNSNDDAINTAQQLVNFSQLGISRQLTSILFKKFGIVNSTKIQSLAIPDLLKSRNVIFTGETGSGKTLAYLLPIIQQIQNYPTFAARSSASTANEDGNVGGDHVAQLSPNALILAPSKQLCHQISKVANKLTDDAMCFLSSQSTANDDAIHQTTSLDNKNVKILVSTPDKILNHLSSSFSPSFSSSSRCNLSLSLLRHLVLDEADSLLDGSFYDSISEILNKISPQSDLPIDVGIPNGTQMVLCSATIPQTIETSFYGQIPIENFCVVRSDALHRLLPNVRHKFVRVRREDRDSLLLSHLLSLSSSKSSSSKLRNTQKSGGSTIVFCNSNKIAASLHSLLLENHIPHAVLFKKLRHHLPEEHHDFEDFNQGRVRILLATDLGSRGLDTLNVNHVINYEFPNFISDYLHRAGRLGRVGSQFPNAHVTNFITFKWDVDRVWQIETAIRRGQTFHVDANIKAALESRHNPFGDADIETEAI